MLANKLLSLTVNVNYLCDTCTHLTTPDDRNVFDRCISDCRRGETSDDLVSEESHGLQCGEDRTRMKELAVAERTGRQTLKHHGK